MFTRTKFGANNVADQTQIMEQVRAMYATQTASFGDPIPTDLADYAIITVRAMILRMRSALRLTRPRRDEPS